jgi:hypothetical protein
MNDDISYMTNDISKLSNHTALDRTNKVIHLNPNVVETCIQTQKGNKSSIKREEVLMRKLLEFYSFSTNLEQLLPVLLKKSRISLRILDWFTTNYSREYNVTYRILHMSKVKEFTVYDSYKSQLKAYHKRLFDPFCRGRRIYFEYYNGCEIETTVGQLNFFKWAIQNKILDYVDTHIDRIITHMSLKSTDQDSLDQDQDQTQDQESNNEMEIAAEMTMEADNTLVARIDFDNPSKIKSSSKKPDILG